MMDAETRERLGRVVRTAWIDWAVNQLHPKPSWLLPWESLTEPEREVDRKIADEVVAAYLKDHNSVITFAVAAEGVAQSVDSLIQLAYERRVLVQKVNRLSKAIITHRQKTIEYRGRRKLRSLMEPNHFPPMSYNRELWDALDESTPGEECF